MGAVTLEHAFQSIERIAIFGVDLLLARLKTRSIKSGSLFIETAQKDSTP